MGKNAILAFFVLCAFPTGLMMALITPPGQSPDEPAHMARALGLLHGAVLGVRKPFIDPYTGKQRWHTGVKVNIGLFQASVGPVTEIANRPVVTSQDFLASRARPADPQRVYVNLPNTATYFPGAYLPATLGVAVGLLAYAPPYACFLLGRLFMLAAYIAVGVACLWMAAFGEGFLLGILLLPMTLFLGSTYNQDGLLIAMSCLACAALTRGSTGYRIFGLATFVLVLGSKPPYALMIGVFLLPLFGAGFWRRMCEVAIASVPVVLWVMFISAFVVVPFGIMAYHPGPLFVGDRSITLHHADAGKNLHILLARPTRFFTLPWQYVTSDWWLALWMMVGVLGPLQLVLPYHYYFLWESSLVFSLLGAFFTHRAQTTPRVHALVNFFFVTGVIIITLWLILIMLYLDWTDVGKNLIDGFQGRYISPLLPFLLFALPAVRWRFKVPPLLPALPVIALGLYDMGYLPMKLVWNYYLH